MSGLVTRTIPAVLNWWFLPYALPRLFLPGVEEIGCVDHTGRPSIGVLTSTYGYVDQSATTSRGGSGRARFTTTPARGSP